MIYRWSYFPIHRCNMINNGMLIYPWSLSYRKHMSSDVLRNIMLIVILNLPKPCSFGHYCNHSYVIWGSLYLKPSAHDCLFKSLVRHHSSSSLAICEGFPTQRVDNANYRYVVMSERHHCWAGTRLTTMLCMFISQFHCPLIISKVGLLDKNINQNGRQGRVNIKALRELAAVPIYIGISALLICFAW